MEKDNQKSNSPFYEAVFNGVKENRFEIGLNKKRSKDQNCYPINIQPYTISNDGIVAADLYDITEIKEDEKMSVIHKIIQNINFEDENPFYIFFHDNGKWKGIHTKFNNTTTCQHDSYIVDPNTDYSDNNEDRIWGLYERDVINKIKNCNSDYIHTSMRDDFIKHAKETLENYSNKPFYNRVNNVIEGWGNIRLNINQSHVYLNKENEDDLFKALLGTCNNPKLYKYCKADTLNYMINNQTLSMSSIACMNDKTECYYASDYLYGKNPNKNTDKEIAFSTLLNYRDFITSFSTTSQDNLIMWRLYGDEGKGIAIEFDNTNNIDRNDFVLAPVSYSETKESHPELDFLKDLLAKRIEGHDLNLNRWFIWQRFFKSSEYKIENEVRLLYSQHNHEDIENEVWVNASGIFTPLQKFKINKEDNNYPLKVSKVYLGSNFTEAEINKELINEGFKSKSLDIDVEIAQEQYYR